MTNTPIQITKNVTEPEAIVILNQCLQYFHTHQITWRQVQQQANEIYCAFCTQKKCSDDFFFIIEALDSLDVMTPSQRDQAIADADYFCEYGYRR